MVSIRKQFLKKTTVKCGVSNPMDLELENGVTVVRRADAGYKG